MIILSKFCYQKWFEIFILQSMGTKYLKANVKKKIITKLVFPRYFFKNMDKLLLRSFIVALNRLRSP